MLAEVVLTNITPKLDKIYHYEIPENLKISVGSQVLIPFGSSKRSGYVVGLVEKSDVPNLKPIEGLLSPNPAFNEQTLKIAKWISEYYCSYFISALRLFLPPSVKNKEKRVRVTKPVLSLGDGNVTLPSNLTETGIVPLTQKPVLNKDQQKSIDTIIKSMNDQKGETFLLKGPPGSGKTEVYMRVVEEALKNNQGSIVLVPEIGLTSQIVNRFKERFGENIALLHSGLTDKEKNEEWQRIANGMIKIVLGTRIALFAPVQNLKVVILDEEFETTYKSEQSPRYHARTVAEFMALNLGVIAIFGSATPSVESFYKTQTGEYKLLELSQRISMTPPPVIEIIDMQKDKRHLLSQKLRQEIKEALNRNEKVILFINRRGFFTYVFCDQCGYALECPNCATSLIYHYKEHKLTCGHCGFSTGINLVCPKCQNSSIKFFGIGTQRIQEEISEIFPKAKTVRIDKDSVEKKGSHAKLFHSFTHGDANILIGTQIVTKGLDLAEVTLVGVVSADSMLNIPDFRSAELAYAQLVQAAGRAGRQNLPGKVIIQTYSPDNYAIKFAAVDNYAEFYKEELKHREELFYPPFSKLIGIEIRGKNEQQIEKTANDLKAFLIKRISEDFCVLGPTKPAIQKIRGAIRQQILLKGNDLSAMRSVLLESLSKLVKPYDIRVTIDIEPVSLL